jgi:hypothetical protein
LLQQQQQHQAAEHWCYNKSLAVHGVAAAVQPLIVHGQL